MVFLMQLVAERLLATFFFIKMGRILKVRYSLEIFYWFIVYCLVFYYTSLRWPIGDMK